MDSITVLAARYGKQLYRFCIHPGVHTGFPDYPAIERSLVPDPILVEQDEQGILEAISGKSHFFYDPLTGKYRFLLNGSGFSGTAFSGQYQNPGISFSLNAGDRIYGFGAATGKPVYGEDSFRMENRDTLLYAIPGSSYSSFPFFLILRNDTSYGVFLPTPLPVSVDFYKADLVSRETVLQISFDPSDSPVSIDWFIFAGSPAEIISAYASLVGTPPLPPPWALGFHQSRWSYPNQSRVEELADLFRKNDIPCDAIYLDIDYMDRYRVFSWNLERFPAPFRMNQRLATHGIRTVAIVDPGISAEEENPIYTSGKAADAFCLDEAGLPFQGKVWPGVTVFPDFLNPETREWWAENHRTLFENGVSGIWNDMNEPVLKVGSKKPPGKDPMFHGKTPHRIVRNLYAYFESLATWRAFELFRPEERPFILSRAGSPGIQKQAFLWTGDNHASWSHLQENLHMVLHLGLSGVPFSGADVGGFGSGPGIKGLFRFFRKPELYVRWMELGSLMPFFRVHQAKYSISMEPWRFSTGIMELARKQIRRRYTLIPFLYTLAREASQTGMPLVRPLFFSFPEYAAVTDQFMLGSEILVAPVMHPSRRTREVQLPSGEWVDYETGARVEGPKRFSTMAPPGSYPIFVRSGSILPVVSPGRNVETSLSGPIFLQIYPAKTIQGKIYIDDGKVKPQVVLEAEITGKMDRHGSIQLQLNVDTRGKKNEWPEVFFRIPPDYTKVFVDGRPVQCRKAESNVEDSAAVWLEFPVSWKWEKILIQK